MNDLLHRDLLEDWLERPLPAALLIAGPAGIGKAAFAAAIARRLVGADERAPAHADILITRPNEELKTRPVDIAAIRDLIKSLSLTSTGARRVALVLEADRMTVGAANALLKTLEEPRADTNIILTASEPWRLPATIRSRLAVRTLPLPSEDEALAFLKERAPNLSDRNARRLLRLSGGAPWKALAIVANGVGLAEGIAKLAQSASRGAFDRASALALANEAGESGWDALSSFILRFLYLGALRAAGLVPIAASELEAAALDAFAAKSGTRKSAEAWRIVSEIKRATETQGLAKPWSLYRMTLSLEWACK